jgi:transcription elongation factor GreA
MRVPIRKGDKRLGQKPDPYLTAEKFLDLQNKLERLRNFSRPKEAAEVRRLAEMGDFSENAGYQLAKGRLRGINQRIIDLENHLKVAEIIKADPQLLTIQIGSRVSLEKAGKQIIYTILGSSESDPINNVISYSSPLGAALIGHVVNDRISLILAGKKVEYVVKKVEQL